jgi:hypothetical protein
MNVSKLSKVELNRAMIWLYPLKEITKNYTVMKSFPKFGLLRVSIDFLTDYNLTMPLAFENNISTINESGSHWAGTDVMAGDGPCIYMENDTISKDPLRAICEVLVIIAMEERA